MNKILILLRRVWQSLLSKVQVCISGKPHFPVCLQHDSIDCGPASLSMISQFYGKRHPLYYLREISSIDRQGVSLFNISNAAEKIGFRTLGTRLTLQQLLKDAPLPCIVHWRQEHYVVVYHVGKHDIHVADPAAGLLAYSRADFAKNWISTSENDEEYGIALLLEPTPQFHENEAAEKDPARTLPGGFQLLLSYAKRFKKLIFHLWAGIILVSILQLIFPFLTQAIVDIGIVNQNLSFISIILIAQITLFASRTAVDFIQNWIVLHVGTRIDVSMISDFLLKLMRLSVSFFDSKMTGDILQRIQEHTRIQQFLTTTTLTTFLSILNLFVFSIVLALYNIPIFMIFWIGSILYILYIIIFLKRRQSLDYKRFTQSAKNQGILIELINGMEEIKIHNGEQQRRWDWEKVQASLFKVNIKGLALDQYQQGGAFIINETKNMIIMFLAAQQVVYGNISLGMLLAIQYILGQLNAPLNELIGFFHIAQDAKISLERLNDIHQVDDEESPHSLHFFSENADLEVKQLSFGYSGPTDDLVLEDLDLLIPHGKITAIVGASGSGKTTLLKLLLKSYRPLSGEIRLGGMNLQNISHHFWRSSCGVVMQDGFIFSDSIAKNIAMSEDKIDMQKLFQATQIANIQDLIDSLPLSFNTRIGPNGVGLSKGQQQRLLIARAVYKSPQYLFFDEATSALDAATEKTIVENLNHFFKGRTVVVIAHRLSTVKNADQIIVLDRGKIIENGTHQELTALKGSYFHLVKNQLELGN